MLHRFEICEMRTTEKIIFLKLSQENTKFNDIYKNS